MQSLLRAIYPAQCLLCEELTVEEQGLCPACWARTPFLFGLVCDLCGTALPGVDEGVPVHCDDCLRTARPWDRGRAALRYDEAARELVLRLKRADRTELARPAARWLGRAAAPLLEPAPLLVPVPLHRTRLLGRRYNQSALLAQALGRELGLPVAPDLLVRRVRTRPLAGRSHAERFALLADAIALHPRRRLEEGGAVLLVDDVMTSGATLAASTEALRAAGAGRVCVLTLARAVKDA
ncbi:Competence protein F [Oceanicola granulosus HTCC2516]|uniref:Competence protein F n=1 Tax=Oceanicola granulosus (strain ATCC BAA-861 / DSM 15982 / KCTC 12143 / HTCC2516) TaxID=314256 RepID=Q2CJR2_OCEGH|nr:ComF family protein [Oceanicola granulosus]EAR53077.1 Competence protein F [Oceanicola granulosus HTCC2516]